MPLSAPTSDEVKGTGRPRQCTALQGVCGSEGYLAMQGGGGIPVSSPACSPTSSSRRSSSWTSCTTPSTHAGTATSLSTCHPRPPRCPYACCCLFLTWTLAISFLVDEFDGLAANSMALLVRCLLCSVAHDRQFPLRRWRSPLLQQYARYGHQVLIFTNVVLV